MQLNLLLIASLLGLSQAVALGGLKKRGLSYYSGPKVDNAASAELTVCIATLKANPQWTDFDCGGRSFFMGRDADGIMFGIGAWDSPADCLTGCLPQLNESAANGMDWGKCDQQTGFGPHCWVGYCPLGKRPGGNDDGSCQ